ncbi:MAG: sensor domain-containing diguanylate cyclase [Gammaproteobacteria bacterium]|nr:sensor domain-containing diguanylate cyclase [Gammaproteobacteria bacterium]MCW8993004.1 sensor domain-containing diguanylate cyclase [Gammaproteobacteria bacterium]
MRLLTSRWKLLGIIGSILTMGFVAVNLAHYYVSSNSVRDALINNELPLTSNNIYSEIQAGLLRPIYISSLMANDTFLKDWMLDGEQDVEKITRYLAEIRERYEVSSTFVVSNVTRHYYHFNGVLKRVSPDVPKDAWFFSMESHENNYRVDVDYNEAEKNTLTIFVNHKLYDHEGNFLGVTGLGLDVVRVGEMIERYMQDYQRSIYFVDKSGKIKSHHNEALIERVNIRDMRGIADVADQLLGGERGFLHYYTEDDTILLSYRYLPELDWYLVVEQPEGEALRFIRNALYFNLAISTAITLLVLLISGYAVNLFQLRLESLARTDKLTGLTNRQYFDAVFEHALRSIGRRGKRLSLAVFDIDYLKAINDRYGHLEGDRILTQVAQLAREGIRKSDVISRWGGDEFVILFIDCDEGMAAELVEAIRRRIRQRLTLGVEAGAATISAGVAEYQEGDTPSALLARADERLYVAKTGGRDRVAMSGGVVAQA